MERIRLRRACAIAIIVTALAGCTQERALALKAGAEAFSAKSAAAIDAVVDLGMRSMLGKAETEEVLIRRTREDLLTTQRDSPSAMRDDAVINEAFAWLTERDRLRRDAFSKYDELKTAYDAFGAAYARLPEGSLFAAKDVSCSAALGARLVGYMAGAAQSLARTPVPLIRETVDARSALRTSAAQAVSSRNEQPFDAVVRARVALAKEEQRANAEAVGKLADAAESGLVVLEMIDKYDNVSVADLMQALRQVLVVRTSITGLSSDDQIKRLDNVTAKLNSKPALAAAIQLPLNQKPAECR